MAFEQVTIRLPAEYVRFIKDVAGEKDESQGYMIQQAIHGMNNKLPAPRRRDRREGEES